jgi:4,5-dihydroxyphthalate decarboxylase
MSDLSMTMATGMHERARPLAEGRVQAQGLHLTTIMLKNNQARHDRFLAGEFDAAEFSLALYLKCWSDGAPFFGIPVFLNRQFRHGAIFVNARAGITAPHELKGKRIGVASWFNTAALWARGALEHEHGLALRDVHWVTGTKDESAALNLPGGISVEDAKGSLVEMLVSGKLDALVTPRTIARDHPGRIVRLFPDFRAVEQRYYCKTGVFPMSHVLVVRKALLDAHDWLARSIIDACDEARRLAYEYADDPEHSMLAWFGAQWEEESALFRGDAWANGVEPNRKALEALVAYGYSSGLLTHKPAIDGLFHTSSTGRTPAKSKGNR